VHLRTVPSSAGECGAPLFSFFNLDFPVTAVSSSGEEDVAVVAVARERLLRDLLQNDVSVGILMMLGKSENESSTNCDSHSSSATSSVCAKKKKQR
jgi:hypothetical protein